MNRQYLVTGANGHLGQAVVRQLLDTNENVVALLHPSDTSHLPKSQTLREEFCNITEKDQLERIFASCPTPLVVIHCAGIVSIKAKANPIMYQVNVMGTKNVVDLCMQFDAEKMIYVSSVHALKELDAEIVEQDSFNKDEIIGSYAQTKAEAGQYVLEMCKKGLRASIVHPSGIIGPYDFGHGHLTLMVIDACTGKLTSCVKGGYDFVDVRDVARGLLSAVDKGRVGECYILSNEHVTVKDLLFAVSKASGSRPVRHTLPLWFVKFMAPLCELYYKIRKQPPLFTRYSLHTLTSKCTFSKQKAVKELGYTNTPLEKTMQDTVHFLRETGRIGKKSKK